MLEKVGLSYIFKVDCLYNDFNNRYVFFLFKVDINVVEWTVEDRVVLFVSFFGKIIVGLFSVFFRG